MDILAWLNYSSMKRILPSSVFAFLLTTLLCGPADVFSSNKPGNSFKHQKSNSAFIENKGQIIDQNNNPNPAVLYLLNTPGMNVQLRKGGFSYDVYETRYTAHGSRDTNTPSHASHVTRHDSSTQYPTSSIQYPSARRHSSLSPPASTR